MPKKSKKEKKAPNIVVFLVEGESDQIALESGLSELVYTAFPEYEVKFLLQQRLVNSAGDELDDSDDEGDDFSEDDEIDFVEEEEYKPGGDITSSSFVTPQNIETKITNRFIKPAIKAGGGFYEKKIVRVIQIVDLDGAYLTEEHLAPLAAEHSDWEGLFYNPEAGVIETDNREDTLDRNDRKKKNLDYLLSLTKTGIKIKSSTIPYEIYFFSRDLDHFINNDPNMKNSKKYHADRFNRAYGIYVERFCKFFFDDPGAIGRMGYDESWDEVRRGSNSVKRFTNIDCLIKKLRTRQNKRKS